MKYKRILLKLSGESLSKEGNTGIDFDKMLKVGDVYVTASGSSSVLFDIEDPYFITQKLQEIVIDIKTDVQFPNDLRPKTNHGYQTTHKGN